jgi:diaminopimelate epimerase
LILHFNKYHGTGNDFILVDNRAGYFNPDPVKIAGLCNRRFGIGADGLILLESKAGYDFRMRYYNADGNESSMCGNGGRCITAFADFLSLPGDHFLFFAIDGDHSSSILEKKKDSHLIKLKMSDVLSVNKWGIDDILDTGSPHLVRFAGDTDSPDVVNEGRKLRNHPDFKTDGINVNFVKIDGEKLHVRTYERGVEDETLSCGTGVTASALAYASKKGIARGPIIVETRGGKLKVYFTKSVEGFTDIWLEGTAVRVFDGYIEI